jgi:hypothetical protein
MVCACISPTHSLGFAVEFKFRSVAAHTRLDESQSHPGSSVSANSAMAKGTEALFPELFDQASGG